MEANRTQAVQAAFSPSAIVDGICEGVRASDKQLEEFKSGMRCGILTSVKSFSSAWMDQQPKFKGLVVYKGTPAVRFRFTSDRAGITLTDMAIGNNSQGKPVVVDFYNQALGFDMVEQGRQTATPILAEMDKTFLDRLLGKPKITDAELRRFGELSRKFRDGDSRGAVSVYKSLPEILRTNVTATAIYIMAVQRTGDNDAYKKALKDAAARFKTANFQFMLVDLYFLQKEYDKAIECLDNFVKAVGEDAAAHPKKFIVVYQARHASSASDLETGAAT